MLSLEEILSSMYVLFEGITNLFGAEPHSNFYSAIDGELHLDEAPQKQAFPYCVFLGVPGIHSFMFDPEEFETVPIQFNIHSDDPSAIEGLEIADKLMALFDDTKEMVVTGYNVVWFRRTTPPYPFKVDDKRQVTILYEVLLEKAD